MAARGKSDTKSKETPSQSAAPPLYHRLLPLPAVSSRFCLGASRFTREFQPIRDFFVESGIETLATFSGTISDFSHGPEQREQPIRGCYRDDALVAWNLALSSDWSDSKAHALPMGMFDFDVRFGEILTHTKRIVQQKPFPNSQLDLSGRLFLPL